MGRPVVLIFALLLVGCAATGEPGSPPLVVIDGDTIRLDGVRVRLADIDAPEIGRARCDAERRAGIAAREALRLALRGGNLALQPRGIDRYGRTLAVVLVDGRDVAADLMRAGHVVPYRRNARHNWCGTTTVGLSEVHNANEPTNRLKRACFGVDDASVNSCAGRYV